MEDVGAQAESKISSVEVLTASLIYQTPENQP